MKTKLNELRLNGIPVSRGIAIGKPFFFTTKEDAVPEFNISKLEISHEINRYTKALKQSFNDVKKLKKNLKKDNVNEGELILDTYLEIMQDPLLTSFVEDQIRKLEKNAEYVFHIIILDYRKKFQMIEDPFFQERFNDVLDVSRRIMRYLKKSVQISVLDIPQNSIVFSQEITATDTAESRSSSVKGFVTLTGSATSHAAIVAKAKGIPYVSSVKFEGVEDFDESTLVIVDGIMGEVIINPTEETLDFYQNKQLELALHESSLTTLRELVPETIDGYRVGLAANIDGVNDLDTLFKYGSHGVGLFRSEYIFLANHTFPTEDDQFAIYQKAIVKMKGLPIVIRTFDFGGDKMVLNQHIDFEDLTKRVNKQGQENHSFLGTQSIRSLLKEPDIFKTQLKAIIRASAFGSVKILFPMISAFSELMKAKEIFEDAKAEVVARGDPIADHIPIGCMIEVPSAAIIADLLARECDFLSIGTNDLVQYSLAVDRRSHLQGGHYDPTDPSVIRMIKLIVSEANLRSIPVTVCGEVAADPRMTPLLLGLGVHELSVAPRYIPVVKRAIRSTHIVEACQLAETALLLTSAREIFDLLSHEYLKSNPGDQYYC